MQARVRERFATLQKLDNNTEWNIVDAAQSISDVEADIWKIVSETVGRVKDQPIKRMWQEGNYKLPRDEN